MHRAVERRASRVEVSLTQLSFTGLEMLFRLRDEFLNRVALRLRCWSGSGFGRNYLLWRLRSRRL
jgi:hypothetical protein